MSGVSGHTDELWRTQLCRHGAGCRHREHEGCAFAHSLTELRPPYECYRIFDQAWTDDKVERWYGQRMSVRQLERFHQYYRRTPHYEAPCGAMVWRSSRN